VALAGTGALSRPAVMRAACVLTLALAAALAACGSGEPQPKFNATDITGVQWARGFELNDHTGQHRTFADFKGQVVLVFFGFTNCPDACPLALAEMAQVVRQLGPDAHRVQGLFITVDPKRDTSERLASYVPAFHPSFLGLRGSAEETARVANEFKIYYQARQPDKSGHSGHGEGEGSYMVDHSTGIYIFDKEGRARLYVRASDRSVNAMVHDVKLLLGR
jgi:protein SCO1/2